MAQTRAATRNTAFSGSKLTRDKEGTTRKPQNTSRGHGPPEAIMKNMKCFKCHQKGYIRSC